MTDTTYFDLAEVERTARAVARQALESARSNHRPGHPGDVIATDALEQLAEILVVGTVRISEMHNRRCPPSILGHVTGNILGSLVSSAVKSCGLAAPFFVAHFQEAFHQSFDNLQANDAANSTAHIQRQVPAREGGRA